jgi:hypothetical protein
MKRLVFIGVLCALGVALANRRRLPPERVDVYREDGALQTFEAGSDVADHVLPAARKILAATR